MAEPWDIYDAERMKTGRTMTRGSEFKEGDLHLVVHVCVFNREGKMLIQQRQSFKDSWPNRWDLTAGGSATAGDSSQAAAARELEEELGIRLDLEGVRPQLTINFERGFNDVYLIEKEIDLDQLTLQYEEVRDAKWATADEIEVMIEDDTFIPYYPSLIRLLFDIRRQYGCRRTDRSREIW
ncbi:NUDIX hydrolase [Bhargavaea cecembensis]|uniref:NUDIX hydrolase n=1 Tax=Bhargavaea cecembensis TaxID=394098 RepID=A0A161SR55_9BACL|nr:NUDIX domain-containing protein [Bhargavaea cecembensis]KZE37810.1 NUDIX hydrolase [Bhargavaea cecembensis]